MMGSPLKVQGKILVNCLECITLTIYHNHDNNCFRLTDYDDNCGDDDDMMLMTMEVETGFASDWRLAPVS